MKSVNRDIQYIVVKEMPLFEDMEQDVVYLFWYGDFRGISIHRCMCGCGEQVVMPFVTEDSHKYHNPMWKLSFPKGKINFEGSVGNYSFPCKSHYMIQKGQVRMFDS